jgi:hypothetical protein
MTGLSRRILIAGLGCAAAGGVLLLPAAANAAPTGAKNAQLLNVQCDNGLVGQVVTMGNGDWTTAHLVGRNTVFNPIAFGASTFTGYDANGAVVFSQTDPAVATDHAAGRATQSSLAQCSYDSGVIDVSGDPQSPPGVSAIEFSGTVVVAVAGRP